MMDTFFFFVPNRLLWDNWQKFNGEQDDPGDSISFTIPQVVGTWTLGEVGDYMGLPTATPSDISVSSLPFRAYNLIYNEWFRDLSRCNEYHLEHHAPVTSGSEKPAESD